MTDPICHSGLPLEKLVSPGSSKNVVFTLTRDPFGSLPAAGARESQAQVSPLVAVVYQSSAPGLASAS